jgi:hypothetical protein
LKVLEKRRERWEGEEREWVPSGKRISSESQQGNKRKRGNEGSQFVGKCARGEIGGV